MPVIRADEKTFQIRFYEAIFGENNLEGNIHIDRNTDGYTDGIIFEHKTNVIAYGRSKALSQVLIYLTRFNASGYPVPRTIAIICQERQKAYIYDANDYIDIINNIVDYGSLKASNGIENFTERHIPIEIDFNINSAQGMMNILNLINEEPKFVKVNIDIHNVYGWSNFYYKYADLHGQKPEKKKFFDELRNPIGTLEKYINPWTGSESDFTLIMDLLNDPMTQKKLGAFYTPELYCKLAHKLLQQAISRVPDGNDYVIIDRCAGTGNLEEVLSDDELSHVIINTYELKEWYVLKDRIGHRVRYVIPPIPTPPKLLPDLNSEGFLSGANALTKEFIDTLNDVIDKTKVSDKVTVILYENPPYIETTGIEFQMMEEPNNQSDWKNTFVVEEMKKEISGPATNDMGNAFIWSGFHYFLKEPTDSYVLFSPAKYWKAQHLIDKKFLGGYAVNRKFFHAPTPACIMVVLWSNENETISSFELKAINLDETMDNYIEEGTIKVKRINSLFSEKYYDNNNDSTDTFDGIACELNGLESFKPDNKIRVKKNYNDNIIGYLVAQASGFDNNRLLSSLHIAGRYNANGFYLRRKNFIEKLPMFVASRYSDHYNDWKIMSMIMKSADGSNKYYQDLKNGKLDSFMCKCLIWTGLTHYAHMRSLNGSDNRLYLNQLCFDGDDTFAAIELNNFINNGYVLTPEEENLFSDWNTIITRVRQKYSNGTYRYPYNEELKQGYNPNYKYGLYQIDEEVNYKIDGAPDRNGLIKKVYNDGDLNNLIKAFKSKLKMYYTNNLVDTLFEYEFLK